MRHLFPAIWLVDELTAVDLPGETRCQRRARYDAARDILADSDPRWIGWIPQR